MDQIEIPLSRVRDGQSDFSIDLKFEPQKAADDRFTIDHLDVLANVTILGDEILLRMKVVTDAETRCDRCGDPFQTRLKGQVDTLFTSDPLKIEGAEGGEVRLFDVRSADLDITQEVIDALFLGIPDKVVCRESCRGLCPQCGTNLNESECDCQDETIDPRWEALRKLKHE